MAEMKFTPGPWKAHKLPKPIGFAEWEIHWSSDGECVTEIVYKEADAHLIAAAPEMYEALKVIYPLMKSYPEGYFRDAEIEMVQVAIAKAEGKEG